MDPHHEIVESVPGREEENDTDRAPERRYLEQVVRTTNRIFDERDRYLDRFPQRQANKQFQPKLTKTEEIHFLEIIEKEILQIVVENYLGVNKKKTFIEAKRKALVPWAENNACRPISRSKYPKKTIIPIYFLLRYKEN